MKVLSLFDGLSGGRVALERAGIKVDNYYASEIDKYAIQIAKKNYPDTIHIGDVTKVKANDLPKIELLIGGSPCQGFSFAGKLLNFEDERSKLFFEFVRLIEECKPKYFLLENVKMKKEYQDVITRYLGVEPILINSSLVSAQNRERLYWTNIPNVEQPEDKGILLKDILEKVNSESSGECEIKTFNENSICHHIANATNIKGNESIKRVYAKTGKSPTLTTIQGGHRKPKILLENIIPSVAKNILEQEENIQEGKNGFYQLKCSSGFQDNKIGITKTPSLRAGNSSTYVKAGDFYYRKLTPLECERLQTLPDNYTEGVSNTQRYKMIGNGWTIDVVSHIFKGLL